MRRVPAPIVLLAVAALVLTACGSSPEDLLDRAPDALEEAGTSRFEMRVTATGEGVDSSYSAQGEQDLDAGVMRMDADLGLESTRTETLAVGEVVYVRSPLFAMFTGDEDLWVRVDLEESAREAGLDVDALVESNAGPAALLQQLRGAADEVEELGDEDVRGAATTHLRVIVDTERAIEDSPAEVREQLRAYAEASGLPNRYPMEVWIDDDGLPRRLSTIVDVEDEVAGTVTQQTVLELYDFGIEVRAQEPDPEQVVELRDLLEDLAALEAELEGDLDDADDGPGAAEELEDLEEQLEELGEPAD